MTITFDPPSPRDSSHAFVVAAILASGGRLAASFELARDGRTVGARLTSNRFYRCSTCGRDGHSSRRCNGEGKEPKLPSDTRAKIERLQRRADYDLETAKAEIARRVAARGKL